VLRYLADAYKALRNTVPDEAKTEELQDIIEWLGELVRQVDSSLIDEWEKLRNPTDDPLLYEADPVPPAVTANGRAFRVLRTNTRNARPLAVTAGGTGSASSRRGSSVGLRSFSHSSIRLESTWRTSSPSHSMMSCSSSVFASSGTVFRNALYASARYRST